MPSGFVNRRSGVQSSQPAPCAAFQAYSPDACHRPFSGRIPDARRTSLWARRCLRRESRRIILAFAARTASVLIERFLGDALFGLLPVVGIIGCNGVGLVEPCSAGCMLMGPVNADLRRGIADNAHRSALFVRSGTGPAAASLKGLPLPVLRPKTTPTPASDWPRTPPAAPR